MMSRFFTGLFAVALLLAAGCTDHSTRQPVLDTGTNAYTGRISIRQTDGSVFQLDNLRVEASREGNLAEVRMINVRFSPAMPEQVSITMVLRDVPCVVSAEDGSVTLRATDLRPSMGNNPSPVDFAVIRSLSGIVQGKSLSLDMMCEMTAMAPGVYPIFYEGVLVE